MTITMTVDGERHDICLPDCHDAAVAELVPLLKMTGNLANTHDTRQQIRAALIMALEYGAVAAGEDLRELYRDGVTRVMGAAA